MRNHLLGAALTALLTIAIAAPASAATTCANREAQAGVVAESAIEIAVLCETNNRRVAEGLAPLPLNQQLSAAAREHARDMATRGYFSHTSPEGSQPEDRAGAQGYVASGCCGENIADGYRHAEAVVVGWMASLGHRMNILDPGYAEIGVGVVGDMYVQVFSMSALAPGITGLEPAYQGNAGRDPAVSVSTGTVAGTGRPRLFLRSASGATLQFTATNVRTGAVSRFEQGGVGSQPLRLPAGRWRLCWELAPADPYSGASGCLAAPVRVAAASGVRVVALSGRRVDLLGGAAVGRTARLAVQRRVLTCSRQLVGSVVVRSCLLSGWRTLRSRTLTLRQRQRLHLGRGIRRGEPARVVLRVAAFEAGGIPYTATRLVKGLRAPRIR